MFKGVVLLMKIDREMAYLIRIRLEKLKSMLINDLFKYILILLGVSLFFAYVTNTKIFRYVFIVGIAVALLNTLCMKFLYKKRINEVNEIIKIANHDTTLDMKDIEKCAIRDINIQLILITLYVFVGMYLLS